MSATGAARHSRLARRATSCPGSRWWRNWKRANGPSFADHWQRIAKELRLAPFQIPFVERELRSLHQLVGLREAGKQSGTLSEELVAAATGGA